MALELILQEAQGLSEEALMEVLRFMTFIKSESARLPPRMLRRTIRKSAGKSDNTRGKSG